MVERGLKRIDEVVPFINRVFRKRFKSLLPKIYTDNKYVNYHYVIRENGVIKGNVGAIPVKLNIYDRSLAARGIGMVAVDKSARGKGYMSAMLKAAIADAEEEGVDFMFLSGNRQRYEHFGFVPSGYKYGFTLTSENMRHVKDSGEYSFVKLDADSPLLAEVAELYDRRGVGYKRDDFYKVTSSWNVRQIYAILDGDKKAVGHIAYQFRVVDFNIAQGDTAAVFTAFAKYKKKFELKIEAYPSDGKALKELTAICQYWQAETACAVKIIDYANVIRELLYMNVRQGKTADAECVLKIGERQSLYVAVKGDAITVENTDRKEDIFLTEREATYTLFSPAADAHNGLPFKLPLFMTMADNV